MHLKIRPTLRTFAAGGAGVALLLAACSSADDSPGDGAGGSGLPTGGTAGGEKSGAGSGGAPSPSGGSPTAGMSTSGIGGSSVAGAAGTSTTPSAGTGSSGSAGAGTGGGAGVSGRGSGGASGTVGTAGTAGTGGGSTCPPAKDLEKFSFFVTSYKALQALSGKTEGFGGDLRYGQADGLSGADKICTEIAERSMKCGGTKQWKAFLSVTKGGASGGPIHAIDRIGEGPWYDRTGRTFALTKAALLNQRPSGADPAIINDFPNEDGVPNHAPDGMAVDNHDMLTGTNDKGQLYTTRADPLESTCKDWTSSERWGAPRVGHPWPTGAGKSGGGGMMMGTGGGFGGGGFGDLANWMSALDEAGCAAGSMLVEKGGPDPSNPTVGSGGGYGGFYCFALTP